MAETLARGEELVEGPAHAIPYGRDARAAAVRRVAALMVEHLDGLSVRSASEIWNREAEFRETLAGPEDLFGPCRTTMGSALRSLVEGRLDDQEIAEVRAVGKVASQQGLPLEVVLRGLRVDFLVLWSEMLLVGRTTDPTTQQSLMNASEIVWGAVDAVTSQFTIGYRSNHEARVRAESARREELLRRVVSGESAAPHEVNDVLGLTSSDEVVLVVVDAGGSADGASNGAANVEDLARAMRYASMHSCWTRRDEDVVGVVATRGRKPENVLEALRGVAHLRAGVARARRGVVDLPAALREASLALSSMRAGTHGVATMFDDPITVLVAAQPELSEILLRDVLAPLLARPAKDRDLLLETLVAFDDLDGSIPAVAEQLFCHRNTVLNRITKISRLTGISFTAPSGLALVALAARAVRSGLMATGDDVDAATGNLVPSHSPTAQRSWTHTARREPPVVTFSAEPSVTRTDA